LGNKCIYGQNCRYAHNEKEYKELVDYYANVYKNKDYPCELFASIGFCPYGPHCHWTHDLGSYDYSKKIKDEVW
jgi:hypothetical protein